MALDLARSLPPELELRISYLSCHLECLRRHMLVFVKLLKYSFTFPLLVRSVRLVEIVLKEAIVGSRIGQLV